MRRETVEQSSSSIAEPSIVRFQPRSRKMKTWSCLDCLSRMTLFVTNRAASSPRLAALYGHRTASSPRFAALYGHRAASSPRLAALYGYRAASSPRLAALGGGGPSLGLGIRHLGPKMM